MLFSEEAVRLAGIITQMRQLSVAPLVARAAQDLSASVVLPEVASLRGEQQATVASVLEVLSQRAETLRIAAEDVIAMPPPEETVYTPISTADAVIRYAGNFVPSWAGAIAIDLLPAVLVFIVAITQAAIRSGRGRAGVEDTLTLSEFRAALGAVRDVERAMRRMPHESEVEPAAEPREPPGKVQPLKTAGRDD